jgi:hypothetical protein
MLALMYFEIETAALGSYSHRGFSPVIAKKRKGA